MKKIMCVFGTRPEAIKMCPLVKELKTRGRFEVIVCVTGQHREMLEQVLKAFDVEPKYNLNIMMDNQTLFNITMAILEKIKNLLESEKPDMVLVQGDTSTTYVTALACFYLNIPIGHVEAGLRTDSINSPFPEEFNRRSVSMISTLDFAPTSKAKENLIKEGKSEENIFITGNTAIDALKTTVLEDYSHEYLRWAENRKLILITAHRRESIGAPMKSMFKAIKRVLDARDDVCAIYPLHKNPIVRSAAEEVFGGVRNIRLIEPLDVVDFHNFMNRSYMILTDSGGIQEEAPSLGKPVLVMRNVTERPEGVECGTLKLVGTDENRIYEGITELLNDPNMYINMSRKANPYGDGHASENISDALEWFFEA